MKKITVVFIALLALLCAGCKKIPAELIDPGEHETLIYSEAMTLPEYFPLSDIAPEKIQELYAGEDFDYGIMTGDFLAATEAYLSIKEEDESAVILETGDGYIAVGDTSDGSYPGDVYIAKYDKNGKLICEKSYGGNDFDYPYTARYNENAGLLISGKSQSPERVFGGVPFVALFDKETLEFKWSKKVQFAGSADYLSDTAAYLSCGKTTEDGVKIVITKVSKDGEIIWESEPLEQIISDISELSSGKVIVSQRYAENGDMVNKFILIDENGKILKETKIEIYGRITATDDGGFIMVSERPVRGVPQPAYISAIWTDNETVAAKYDENLRLVWRKTYDSLQGEVGTDTVVPRKDGSLMIKKAKKVEE